MPKDREKYRYFEIGVLQDSETLADIMADARAHHMTEHVNKLVALRLAEYYALRRAGALQVAPLRASASNDAFPEEESDIVEEAPTSKMESNASTYDWPD